jgi:hypothetical protein
MPEVPKKKSQGGNEEEEEEEIGAAEKSNVSLDLGSVDDDVVRHFLLDFPCLLLRRVLLFA